MNFFQQLADNIALEHTDLLAADEKQGLVLSAGNADVASDASPGPLTTQPIIAILSGFLKPSSRRRASTSLAISIIGYWVRPQVGQLMISGPATA